jgi:hypothetical protein
MAHDAQPHWQEPGLRLVTELILTEQIVVWTLRRYCAGGERLEGLAGTFRQVFGLGGVEAALAAAGLVIGALERHSRRTESRPQPIAAETIGAAGRCWPAEAEGLFQPVAPCGAVLGSAYQTPDLQPDEKMVLVAMRLWVRRAMQNECGGPVLYRHLAEHGAAEAAPGLHGMLYNLGTAARRPIDMRCPNCSGLSPDEARLIHALASAQAARDDAVLDVMLELLAPAAARLTVEPARGAPPAPAISGGGLPRRAGAFSTQAREAAPAAEPSPLQADGFDCDSGCDDEAGRGRPRVLH